MSDNTDIFEVEKILERKFTDGIVSIFKQLVFEMVKNGI